MADSKLSFVAMDIVLLIVIIGFIKVVFDLHRFFFIAQFLFMGILMILALIGMISIYNDLKFGWTLMAFTLGLILIDLFFIYLLRAPRSSLLLPAGVVSLVGFIISVINIDGRRESKVKRECKPGKYIASKTGAKFHSPKCDWAKKIKKANAVWFDSKEEAKGAGYKADDCVE